MNQKKDTFQEKSSAKKHEENFLLQNGPATLHSLKQIHLQGDPGQQFFHLGSLDRATIQTILDQIEKLISSSFPLIDSLFQKSLKLISKNIFKNSLLFKNHLFSYSEGASCDPYHLLKIFLIIEMIPSLRNLIPNIPFLLPFSTGLQLGCSSLFHYNQKSNSITHTRILDFPLVLNYLNYERSILYEFDHSPKIWSLGLSGLPFPSLTAMNDKGITCALHMKYGNSFNLDGEFIFDLMFRILLECSSIQEVVHLLKKSQAISNWGFYISSSKSNEVLAADLFGKNLTYKIFHLNHESTNLGSSLDTIKSKIAPILYFNNIPIEKKYFNYFYSEGQKEYCLSRKKSFQLKYQLLCKNKTIANLQNLESRDIFKLLGTHLYPKTNEKWILDVLTPNTLHIVSMNSSSGQVDYIPGDAPKIIYNKYLSITSVWEGSNCQKTLQEISSSIETENSDLNMPGLDLTTYRQGMLEFSKAGAFYEYKKFPEAFHHIQMSILYLEGYAENNIAKFFFSVFQYVHNENNKDLLRTLSNFQEILELLPNYFQSECMLFISRIERLLYLPLSFHKSDFLLKEHQALFLFEQRLPRFILKKMNKFIYPQIGTMEVIYGYKVAH